MAFVSVPKDLTKVKNKIIFNLTKRQLICFGIAAAVGLPFYFLSRGIIGSSNAATGMCLLMLPAFLFGYDIPADALSDPQFAKMIQEAEKYLGVPYVWGGYSPSGFDCSGFVSWVINNCGNGWNVGRCTADELRSHCSQVSPSEAKPGDLIFFQGTYDTPGASHVGIYVGNNMMIHCGKPVQYTSIASAYWQEHFMAFGRLH